jgi:hypothetical protein
MIWPHEEAFPWRGRIVIGACVASAFAGAAMPDLQVLERVVAAAVAPLYFAISYWFLLFFIGTLGKFVRPAAVAYAYFAFYGCLASALLFIVLFPVVVFDPEITKPTERALLVAGVLPAALGVCAAVVVLFRRWRGEIA